MTRPANRRQQRYAARGLTWDEILGRLQLVGAHLLAGRVTAALAEVDALVGELEGAER
jgi:hypothetical protein